MRAFIRLACAVFAAAALAEERPDGITPLMLAAAEGDLAKIETALSAGDTVDRSDARGHTAVWHAVNARQPAALAVLLEKAHSFPGRCALGRHALRRALELRDWQLISPLLAASRQNLGWTRPARRAVSDAINAREAARVTALVRSHWRDPVMEHSRHPILAHAILRGDNELTRFLLDCGFSPDTRVGNSADPEFADLVPFPFIRYYLRADRGSTVLMLAAGMQRTEPVRLLVERGARTGASTLRYKMTALSFAAKENHHDIMRLLIAGSPPPSKLRVQISTISQTATLYRDGQPVEAVSISTGVEGKETPTGKFLITDKARHHTSNIYKGAKMPFFMRLNCADFGMHQGIVTGEPASHGCIRLPGTVAKKWFSILPTGTEVSIY